MSGLEEQIITNEESERIMVIVHIDKDELSDLRFAIKNVESAKITFMCPIIGEDEE